MDPKTIPAEQSHEINGDRDPENKPGLYVQPESDTKLFAYNASQGDAFVRLGFKWERGLEDDDIYVPPSTTIVDPVSDAKAEVEAMLNDAKRAAEQIIDNAKTEAARALGASNSKSK